MTDIQAKYQILATEYAKVRSQVPVLKKAVIEEQDKVEKLQDDVKERDLAIRKYEQEVDSLSFRNRQLSSRVEVLQQELEITNTKSKKQKKNNHTTPELPNATSVVINEELQNKIEENAKLHRKLFEVEENYKAELSELQFRLKQLEKEAGSHQYVLDQSVSEYTQQVEGLRDDKIKLEVKLQKREAEKKEAEQKAQSLEEKLQEVESSLSAQLKQAKITIQQKVVFNDSCDASLCGLDLPVYHRQHQLQCRELVGQMAVLVHDFVQSLSNFYTYTEQRVQFYPIDAHREPVSQVSKKYCEHLHENASHLKSVEQAFNSFLETVQEDQMTTLTTSSGLQPFSLCFKHATAYVSKLLPYQVLSLDEENTASLCTSTLQTRNRELQASYRAVEAAFTKIDTCVSALASQSSPSEGHPLSSHSKLLSYLFKAVTDLKDAFEDLAKTYRAKIGLEHSLPTFAEKLRVTNDCIIKALMSLVSVTNKMNKFFTNYIDFLSNPIPSYRIEDFPVKCHPATTVFKHRAADFISSLSRPCPESVPYNTAIHNRKTLYSSTESRDSLAQQVVTLQEKLQKTEQDKEHWMLESKLLQMKYEKECQKHTELQNKLGKPDDVSASKLPSSYTSNTQEPGKTSPAIAPGGPPEVSLLGRLERSMSVEKDVEAREQFIKKHYTEKISQGTVELQSADSKALNFQAECRALNKRLIIVQCDKENMKKELEDAKQNVTQLKDELQTTTRSYEGQLSMMSEHLAGMNEKLTTQKDEIDGLKFQMQQQNTKSTKRSFLGK